MKFKFLYHNHFVVPFFEHSYPVERDIFINLGSTSYHKFIRKEPRPHVTLQFVCVL